MVDRRVDLRQLQRLHGLREIAKQRAEQEAQNRRGVLQTKEELLASAQQRLANAQAEAKNRIEQNNAYLRAKPARSDAFIQGHLFCKAGCQVVVARAQDTQVCTQYVRQAEAEYEQALRMAMQARKRVEALEALRNDLDKALRIEHEVAGEVEAEDTFRK